jgi:hypothetical protein
LFATVRYRQISIFNQQLIVPIRLDTVSAVR